MTHTNHTMPTYMDLWRPLAPRTALIYDAALVLGGALLVGLSAQLALYLPFSPVPVTGQTLAVLLVGVLLGSRKGGLSLLTYLAQGAAGLPVFAGGASGAVYMSGPTGGYLVGFVVAAFVVGWLAERGWDRRMSTALLAMVIGNLIIHALGLPWLASFVGNARVLDLGLYPYLPGDMVKLVIATTLLPSGWKLIARMGILSQPRR